MRTERKKMTMMEDTKRIIWDDLLVWWALRVARMEWLFP
jgi:hypothetical protein